MSEIRRFASEARAAAYYLETQQVRRRSLTDYERRAGCPRADEDREERALRGIVPLDAEATHRAIERALAGFPDEWCGVLLVCLGWGALVDVPDAHERSIRGGPWMRRARLAGLPARWCRLPEVGLTRHALWTRRMQLRSALGREGVLDAGEVEAWEAVERGDYDDGGEMAEAVERPLVGWKAIADHLGCSVGTAQGYECDGLPVCRVGKIVRAYPTTLREWLESRTKTTHMRDCV